ncbi:unnamed protein product [Menidia menidia]|uniref:Septin-7 n=3 Tax=Percomorphaceae TaxID=1489872 RepID=A0A8S4BHT5_9TELE|nr:unnamed protein product [Menidia menidia]
MVSGSRGAQDRARALIGGQLYHDSRRGDGAAEGGDGPTERRCRDTSVVGRKQLAPHNLLYWRDMMDMIEHVGFRNLEGYVGFANLPNQVYRKSVKRGFEFTLMVVGESGLGKSTLINSLFLTDLYSKDYPGPSQRIKKTVQVEQSKVLIKEGGVQLTLTIVDTPGFGDAVDNSNCWQPVINYIDSKCEDFLNAESRVNRRSMPDNRVHCCLYFIAPSGHGLKPLDIEFMKRLHDKVNVIPLIAKADTLTPEECQLFKKQIMKEIQEHKIKIYEFPDTEDDEDNKLIRKIKEKMPLAVVGSNVVVEVNGKKVRGRQYPWGVAEGSSAAGWAWAELSGAGRGAACGPGCTTGPRPGSHPPNRFASRLATPQLVTHRSSCNTPPPPCSLRQVPPSLASRPGHMQVMPLTRAKSGWILGQTLAHSGPSLSSIMNPSCSRPRFSPRRAQTVTEKPYPSPPSELPPLEETRGQWLALDAKGQDSLSFINVENGEHCDFTVLRNMLIRTHMQDLKDVTNNVHYENYRSKKLAAVTCNGVDTSKTKGQLTKSPLAQMEEERREHVMKMKKMEAEMEQVFEMKVKEKRQKLKDSEAELERRHEQMKRNLEAQYKELEEKRRVFEDEKANWEAQQRILEQQKLDASKTMEKNKKKGKIF